VNRCVSRIGAALAALLLFLVAAIAAGAAESERILSFDSVVDIDADAGLTVTETITVLATGESIRHGLVREFPTRYKTPDGHGVTVGFRVLSVRCDGDKEEYRIKDAGNGKRIYMGRKDALLPPGRHTYALTYRTDGQIGQFAGYDELYWNVTGNGWRLPIERATALVRLPPGATVQKLAAYTGPTGAKGRDFTARQDGDTASFATTAPLPPGQGLTVAVSFPKGFVHPPSATQRLLTGGPFPVAAGGLVAVTVYFLLAWLRLGRDPGAGTVVPLYAPPPGVDAPGARYLRRMGFDDKTFAAALVDMAVAGGLRLADDGDAYAVSRGSTAFAPGSWRQAVRDALLRAGDTLRLTQTNHATIAAARTVLRKDLERTFTGRLFHANTPAFVLGALLSAGVLALAAYVADDADMAWVSIGWLTLWTFAMAMLAIRAGRALSRARRRPGVKTVAAAILLTLFAVPFLVGEVAGAAFLSVAVSLPAAAALACIAVLNAVFRHLLKAPTAEGRRVMDALEGFRLYLAVGERERLNLLNPPDRTPELFEKYLPYALALDVEVAWTAQFAGVLARAAEQGYTPVWYSGRSFESGDYSGFAGDLGDGFAASVAAAATAPGSSSGSGGGGSSGGGGGGGGGGGW
jgi:uncharacterized membrane protein YgcG